MLPITAGVLFLGLAVFLTVLLLAKSVWDVVGRPVAVRLKLVEPTGEDYLVRGWQAERGGQWEEALVAYDEARRSWNDDAEVRRADLLQRCPDLAEKAEQDEREWVATREPLEIILRL